VGTTQAATTDDATRTVYEYDAAGNLVTVTAGLSNSPPMRPTQTRYGYDALRRRTSVTERIDATTDGRRPPPTTPPAT
jgi:YD repeat-containing protein